VDLYRITEALRQVPPGNTCSIAVENGFNESLLSWNVSSFHRYAQRPMATFTLILSLMLTLGVVFTTGVLASRYEIKFENCVKD